MKCVFCKQKMNDVITSTCANWGDYEIKISGIPAYECPKCGEKLFSSETVDLIQNIVAGLADSPGKEKPAALNVSETAELLRITNQTVYNMLKDGRLTAKKVGREWRFDSEEVRKLLPESGNNLTIAARGKLTENDANIVKKVLSKM